MKFCMQYFLTNQTIQIVVVSGNSYTIMTTTTTVETPVTLQFLCTATVKLKREDEILFGKLLR